MLGYTSGVPQEDLQVDCPRVSLEKPKSAIFSCDPLCSSRLSSCTGTGEEASVVNRTSPTEAPAQFVSLVSCVLRKRFAATPQSTACPRLVQPQPNLATVRAKQCRAS